MGARIAAHLGATAQTLPSKLVLVDPPLSGPGRTPYPTPLSNYLNAIEAASRGASVDEFRRYTPTWTDEQIALRLEWLPTCSVEAVTQSHRLFHEEDIFPDFPRLICPTLFIYAAKATVVTPDQAKGDWLSPPQRTDCSRGGRSYDSLGQSAGLSRGRDAFP